MKKLISIVLSIAMLVSCFAFSAYAEVEAITLEVLEGLRGEAYPSYTLPGTSIETVTTATLGADQEIVYFHNGEIVGRAAEAGNFVFTSVTGENIFQAKIMSGDTVVAESEAVTLDFVDLLRVETLKQSPLSSEENANVFENSLLTSGWASFVADPADPEAGNVLHIKEPTPAAAAVTLPVYSFSESDEDLEPGIVKADFEFYAEHFQGTVYSAYINTNCGCNHTNIGYADWPSGTATKSSRSFVYPKGKWIDMSIVVDDINKTYDLYADGVQVIAARPYCVDNHKSSRITAINLPCPGWAGNVIDESGNKIFLYDDDGNPVYVTDSNGNITYDKNGNPVQANLKGHGEFYIKNLDIYSCQPATIIVSVAESVVAGDYFTVNSTGMYVEGMQYVYTVNGVASEPTQERTYIAGPAKSGVNTVSVEAYIDGELIYDSDVMTTTGYYAPNETVVALGHPAANDYYTIEDMSQTYPEYGEVGVYESSGARTSIYPQNGLTDTNASGRGYFATSAVVAADPDCLTISYDVNIQQLDGRAWFQLDYYYKTVNENGETATGENWPTVFSFEDNTLTSGATANTTTVPVSLKEWINLKLVFEKKSETLFYLVNDVVVNSTPFSEMPGQIDPFGGNVMFIIFGSDATAEGATNIIYTDNCELGYGLHPSISLTGVENNSFVPAGYDVCLAADYDMVGVEAIYYLNGKAFEGDPEVKEFRFEPVSGKNTVYAELVDQYGTNVATSEIITIYTYDDLFENAIYNQDPSTSLLKNNNHDTKDYGVYEYEADSEKFAADSDYGTVLKLASSEAGVDGNRVNVLTYWNDRFPYNKMKDSKRMYTLSIDVYPESITKNEMSIRFYNPTPVSNESSFEFFKIDSEHICIKNAQGDWVNIPYTKQWYTLKAIYDPIGKAYILSVNDTIYSIIVDEEKYPNSVSVASGSQEDASANRLYMDISLYGTGSEESNIVYVDNYSTEYSYLPAVSSLTYTSNGENVKKRSEISGEYDLDVSFVLTKGDVANVLCVATIIDANGKLTSASNKTVVFDETITSDDVELSLKNVPSDIATGDYTVNVMIWDATNLCPIGTKVVLAD